MLSRIFFFIGFGLILTVAVAFLAVALFFGDGDRSSASRPRPSPFGSPMASGSFEGRTPGWAVRGRLIEATASALRVEFQIEDANGRPLPAETRIGVNLEMVGHAMAPIPATVERLAPGVYQAAGRIAMPGRWRVGIRLPDGIFQYVVEIGG